MIEDRVVDEGHIWRARTISNVLLTTCSIYRPLVKLWSLLLLIAKNTRLNDYFWKRVKTTWSRAGTHRHQLHLFVHRAISNHENVSQQTRPDSGQTSYRFPSNRVLSFTVTTAASQPPPAASNHGSPPIPHSTLRNAQSSLLHPKLLTRTAQHVFSRCHRAHSLPHANMWITAVPPPQRPQHRRVRAPAPRASAPRSATPALALPNPQPSCFLQHQLQQWALTLRPRRSRTPGQTTHHRAREAVPRAVPGEGHHPPF